MENCPKARVFNCEKNIAGPFKMVTPIPPTRIIE